MTERVDLDALEAEYGDYAATEEVRTVLSLIAELRQERESVVVDDAAVKRGWDAVNGVVTQHQIRLILTAALTPDGQEKNR